MDTKVLAALLAIAAFAVVFLLASSAQQGTSCAGINASMSAFLSSSKACTSDSDCQVVTYACKNDSVASGKLGAFEAERRKFDACAPTSCNQSLFAYEAHCDAGACNSRQAGYTDRLYTELLSNSTTCADPKISGYADSDQCFLALRLKTKYHAPQVQTLICQQIKDERVKADCLQITD
jgi:hypothetical protein